MAENSRLLRTLQRISDTARKINGKARLAPKAPSILKSLPEHKPLLPLLLSYGIPSKLAEACADRYDKYANQLRMEAETRLAPHLVEHHDSQSGRVYTLFLKEYRQTLRDWAQIVLNSALKNLKRDSQELENWNITYPPILWLPSPSPSSTRRTTQSICPLLSASVPPHAFPTIYPPPLRPPLEIPLVEWRRKPATSSGSPSTSTHDLDSLCLQFTQSLVIDENPAQPPQPRTSIFSLPTASKQYDSCSLRERLSKRKLSRTQRSQGSPTLKSTAKSRQLSVPPSFPSLSSGTKTTSRKASAPARVSSSKRTTESSKLSDPTPHRTPTASPSTLNTTDDNSDIFYNPGPSTPPLSSHSSLGLTLGQTTPQNFPGSLAGPVTPPALFPDLFSEPIVVPSSVDLSPRSSLVPVADPFTQFRLQCDYFPNTSPTSFYCGSTPGLATSRLPGKSALDTIIGSGYLSHEIPIPTTSASLENLFFSTYAVF